MKWWMDLGREVGCVGWWLVVFDKSILLLLIGCQIENGLDSKVHQKELKVFKKWLKAIRKLNPTKLHCLILVEQILHRGSNDFR